MQWAMRAKAEVQGSPRTWFGTLTLRPEAHTTMLARARARMSRQGIDFDTLAFGDQFAERVKQCNVEITKYLKRVRKATPAGFRYLLVAEHHKSGLPHFHMLVHERESGSVKHAVLSGQWLLGYEQWRLIESLNQATYLCKYLSKATVARVRASGGYGDAVAIVENVFKKTTPTPPPLVEAKAGMVSQEGLVPEEEPWVEAIL